MPKPIQIGQCVLVPKHAPPWLASGHPVWSDMTPVDISVEWREDWSLASVVNHTIVTDPTVRQPGFNLTCHTWSLKRSGPVSCKPAQTVSCQIITYDCGQQQAMNHIVDTFPLTKCKGRLQLLYKAEDHAVNWLQSTSTTARGFFLPYLLSL